VGVIDVGWEAKEREFLLDGVEINLNNQKINESNLVKNTLE